MARAGKVCPHCPKPQPCPDHTPKPWAGSTRRSRLPKDWIKRRSIVLTRCGHICQVCNASTATEVDHIQPGDDHSLANLQGICGDCHGTKTRGEAARARGGTRPPERVPG